MDAMRTEDSTMNRTTTRSLVTATLLATLVLALPNAAQAQSAARQRGMDFSLGLGVAGCTDSVCSNLDPSAHFRLQVLYRVIPYFAVGGHMAFQFYDPDRNAPDWLKGAWSTLVGGELRGILPVGPLEAYVGMALGFMRIQEDGERIIAADHYRSWSNGFGLGFGFGAQYFVHRSVALGLDFWLYKGFFREGCIVYLDASRRVEVCEHLDPDDRARIGVSFTFGMNVTFFLPL